MFVSVSILFYDTRVIALNPEIYSVGMRGCVHCNQDETYTYAFANAFFYTILVAQFSR